MNDIIGRVSSNVFWDIATSDLVLGVITAVLVAAFVVSHLPFIVRRFWPAVDAYAKAAALVQAVAAALLFFLIGFRVADERAETLQLRADLAFKTSQIGKAQATAQDAERLKDEANAKAEEAKGQLDDFRANVKIGTGDSCDWTDDEFARLRKIGRAKRR